MPEMQPPPPLPRSQPLFLRRNSTVIKLFGVGALILMIGAGHGGIYTFLYITLRQQDYALLMGAIALFVLLAVVMYVTRKVDWYARDVS